MGDSLSVIIPVYGETARINGTIEHLLQLGQAFCSEIIVVDGDKDGKTLQSIRFKGVQKVISKKGRGAQLNAGADVATGDVLVFLHADTRMPDGAGDRILQVLKQPDVVGGGFELGIDSERKVFRLIEGAVFWRTRLTRIPYGDQAIFFRKQFFEAAGRFKDIPIMEDVEFMRRIKGFGARIVIIPSKVRTSSRRWDKDGVTYCTLRNWALIVLYLLGVSPKRLARFYQ